MVRIGREVLIGSNGLDRPLRVKATLYGKFHQHLNTCYVVRWTEGNYVPHGKNVFRDPSPDSD